MADASGEEPGERMPIHITQLDGSKVTLSPGQGTDDRGPAPAVRAATAATLAAIRPRSLEFMSVSSRAQRFSVPGWEGDPRRWLQDAPGMTAEDELAPAAARASL